MAGVTLETLGKCNRKGIMKIRRDFAYGLKKELWGFNLSDEDSRVFKCFEEKELRLFPITCKFVQPSFVNHLENLTAKLKKATEEFKDINCYSPREKRQEKADFYISAVKAVEAFIFQAIELDDRFKIRNIANSITKHYSSRTLKEDGKKTRGRRRKVEGFEELAKKLNGVK